MNVAIVGAGVYYCFDAPGQRLQTVVAEVTNTPWGERHAYDIHARTPGRRLSVHIVSSHVGTPAFDATLSLGRRELTRT